MNKKLLTIATAAFLTLTTSQQGTAEEQTTLAASTNSDCSYCTDAGYVYDFSNTPENDEPRYLPKEEIVMKSLEYMTEGTNLVEFYQNFSDNMSVRLSKDSRSKRSLRIRPKGFDMLGDDRIDFEISEKEFRFNYSINY